MDQARQAKPQGAVPQKEANMSIEQFIDNEVKSNDVVLFMKGTPQFPQCGFSGQGERTLGWRSGSWRAVRPR